MIDPDDNTAEELIQHLQEQQQIIRGLYEAQYATRAAARDPDSLQQTIHVELHEEISEMGHIITSLEDREAADETATDQSTPSSSAETPD